MTHEVPLLLPAAGTIPLVAARIRWKLRRPRDGLRLHDKVPPIHALPASDGRTYSLQDLRGSSALVFTANLAHAFGAQCTPHAFLFDRDLRLRYRGRIDDSFVEGRVRQRFLRDAIRAVLHDREPAVRETLPLGCAIDWVRPKPNPAIPWWRRAHELSRTPHDPTYRG